MIDPTGGLGSRAQTGSLQQAMMEGYLAQMAILQAWQELQVNQLRFKREFELFLALVKSHQDILDAQKQNALEVNALEASATVLGSIASNLELVEDNIEDVAESIEEALPKVNGVANDMTFAGRAAVVIGTIATTVPLAIAGGAAETGAVALEAAASVVEQSLQPVLDSIGFDLEEQQQAYEFQQSYYDLVSHHFVLAELMATYQTANQNVLNPATAGQGLLTERESFRQRAAAIINGYRTKDLTFRTFRNEALEQYRTLFDLAGRYSYLAAKSYDYETGLLGTPEGKAVINRIVASRSRGDLTGDVPQATASTLGDLGLAGTMELIF